MIVVVGLIIAFVLILLFSNPATRGCRWRGYRTNGDGPGRRWHCVACGAEVFTNADTPPKLCLARRDHTG